MIYELEELKPLRIPSKTQDQKSQVECMYKLIVTISQLVHLVYSHL